MSLNMSRELWQALCAAASAYPTCTLHLRQHQGFVRSFTVEHGPMEPENASVIPPGHVHPHFVSVEALPNKR